MAGMGMISNWEFIFQRAFIGVWAVWPFSILAPIQ